ncbi:LOW QUALITY PROTEIN: putative inhibitor of apoptosis [Planococcus citri]|uniref:LOW QUALITY PROTEIN: putative inhibitor of apoptosis n=1 Tax=Planococcus citri TaxID=170843 RepID=UPI0031F8259D
MEAVSAKKRKTRSRSSYQANRSAPRFVNYITTEARFKSFEKWPIPEIKTPLELAQVGFFYSGHEDLVQCFSCGGGLSNWKKCLDATFEHAKYYPTCDYVIEKEGEDFVKKVKKTVKNQYMMEESRLSSFDDFWPQSAIKTPKQLARAGFFNTGDNDDEVQCFECGLTIKDWKVDDDVWFKHTQQNPKCMFVFNVKGPGITYKALQVESSMEQTSRDCVRVNRLILKIRRLMKQRSRDLNHPQHDNYKTVEQRMESFKNWPIPQIKKPEELAEVGFFYSGKKGRVVCFHCNLALGDWAATDVASEEHAQWNPLCAFIRQVKGESFVEAARKKLSDFYWTIEARKKSYKTWPYSAYKDPEELYEAGFFYMGKACKDAVQCFDCGLWFTGWEVCDDPWFIHGILNPSCKFLRRMRGETFLNQVEQVLAPRKKASKITRNLDQSTCRPNENIIQELMKSSVIQTVLKVGFNESKVRLAIRYYLKCPESSRTVEKLFAMIMIAQKKDIEVFTYLLNLKKENDRCEKAKICKFCSKQGPISILVPCAHLLSCCPCVAKNLKRCFACNGEIEHRLEMFPK